MFIKVTYQHGKSLIRIENVERIVDIDNGETIIFLKDATKITVLESADKLLNLISEQINPSTIDKKPKYILLLEEDTGDERLILANSIVEKKGNCVYYKIDDEIHHFKTSDKALIIKQKIKNAYDV